MIATAALIGPALLFKPLAAEAQSAAGDPVGVMIPSVRLKPAEKARIARRGADLALGFAIWYSGDSGEARSLLNEDGSWRPNGMRFAQEVGRLAAGAR